MGKKYRIEYDREGCIGAASCVAVAPEHWTLLDDGKAELKDGKLNEAKKVYIVEIEEDQLVKFKEAAEVCPVNVIHIFDIETGEKII